MNALPTTDAESARRREDMLRELNLYPLWQLRAPVAANAVAETVAETRPTPDPVIFKEEQAVVKEQPPATPLPNTSPRVDIDNSGWPGLKKMVKACNACKLRAGCMQTVFGMGDESADWLFVGSWPTEDDETTGVAFSGQAGQLLDNMLAAIKLKRGNNVYFANVVKCCGSITRGPKADEIAQCTPYLTRQIQLLKPKMIVALGHATATALLGEDREWNSLLGKVHEFRGFSADEDQTKDGLPAAIPLIITHHPAALLLSPLNKAQTWKDLCLARDTMLRLIDESA